MILPDRLIAIAGLMKEKNIVLFKNHSTSIFLLQPLLFPEGFDKVGKQLLPVGSFILTKW